MQLTKEQIEHLFQFCEKRRVFHYDLQVEIVDHLANAVEEKMLKDTSLQFETALEQVHKGFGPLGLRSMTASREMALEKKYSKMKWRLFRSYFTWPKFTLTFLLLVITISLPRFLNTYELVWVIIGFAILTLAFQVRFHWRAYRFRKQQVKKLLMTSSSYLYFSPLLLSFSIQFSNLFIRNIEDAIERNQVALLQYYLCAILCICYTLFAVVRNEMLLVVNKKARESFPLAYAK